MAAIEGPAAPGYRLRDVWPRRRPHRRLPPGPRVSRAMSRFSARPHVPPPPVPAAPSLVVTGAAERAGGLARAGLAVLLAGLALLILESAAMRRRLRRAGLERS